MRYNTTNKKEKLRGRMEKYLVMQGYNEVGAWSIVDMWINKTPLCESFAEAMRLAKIQHEYDLKLGK